MIFPSGSRRQLPHHMYHQRPSNYFRPFDSPYPSHHSSPSSSPLKALAAKGVDGLSKTLDNVQNVINVVETTAPMIEKYGPLVKNIPTMYKMMKAIYAADDSDDSISQHSSHDEGQSLSNDDKTSETHAISDSTKEGSGASTPKLYV